MEALIKALPKLLQAVDSAPELREAAAIAAWKHAAGPGLRSHALPSRLDGGTLVVMVRDAIWQKQLASMKAQLLFRVNSTLGQQIVKDIHLRIEPNLMLSKVESKESPEIHDNEIPIELWSAATAIEDKELRRKFLRAAVTALRRRETSR